MLELPVGKPRALLALLLLHADDVVSTDVIAETLWPEESPASAANAIQQYVAQLRRTLGRDEVRTRPPGYLLALDGDRLDAHRAESLGRAGRHALEQGRPAEAAGQLRKALGLFRGTPFADFRYDPFAQAEVARLEELRLALTEDRVEAELELGRHHEVASELEALVSQHPLRERPRGQLMLALYRSGRQADALATFQDGRRALVDELGVEPGPALQELHRRILNQDDSLAVDEQASRPIAAAPVPATPLLGREEELRQLVRLLRDEGTRIVTITGPGGIGKTRLAVEAARALDGAFEDVAFAELAAVRDPELVPSVVAGALGASGDVTGHIGDRRVLLVLDNFEQVVEAAQELGPLVGACPNLAVLVTSRERLRLRGEVECALEPLSDEAAVELFRARAAAVNARLEAPAEDVIELCRRLDRLPLAIELASARARLLTPRELLARLDRRLSLLTDGARDAPARHRTLAATIAWSYDLLEDEERRLFEELAVFAGAFTADDAEAVCSARLGTLASLLDKSLVASRNAGGGLSLLATVREFALERLDALPDADAVRLRHAEHVVTAVEATDELLTGPDQVAALAEIADRQDDIRAVLNWALARRDAPLALRLVAAAGWFWFVRGHLAEGRRWLEAALELGDDGSPARRATVFMRLGAIAFEQGDLGPARRAYTRALELRRALGDGPGSAGALGNLGNVALHEGDYGAARRYYDEGLALARELADPGATAQALHNMATAHLAGGDAAAALPFLEESLGLALQLGDRWGESVVRSTLGGALVDLGEAERAAALLAQSVRLRLELGERYGIASALDELAALALLEGEPAAAARRLGAASAIRSALGSKLGRSDEERVGGTEARVRAALGEPAYEHEWRSGNALSPDDAVAFAAAEAERIGHGVAAGS